LGSAILVYVDESYIHCTHSIRFCWALLSDPAGHHVKGSPSTGKRLIILHAVTKDGSNRAAAILLLSTMTWASGSHSSSSALLTARTITRT
jgi:hypothetical protein